MNKKTLLIIIFVIAVGIGGYFLFDSIYGAGAGLIGLLFGKPLPDGIVDLTNREENLEATYDELEDKLNDEVDELSLDDEANHWSGD